MASVKSPRLPKDDESAEYLSGNKYVVTKI